MIFSTKRCKFDSMNLNTPHIKAFLDGVDLVLNSNTFLLELKADFTDAEKATEEVSEFIRSGTFKNQILKQDLERGWENYHYLGVPDVEGDLFKPNFRIELKELSNEASIDYLRNMLTIEQKESDFYSPYRNQMEKNKAQQLVVNFLHELLLQMNWKLFQLNTDFSYTREEIRNENEMAYFEGDYGSDSATLFVREDGRAFILLTNGLD